MNPAEDVLASIGLTIKRGASVRLLDEDDALFGRGVSIRAAVLDAFLHYPKQAEKCAAALFLAAALDADADAVIEAVASFMGEDDDDAEEEEEEEENVDADDDDEDEDEDEDDEPSQPTIRVRRE